MDLTLIRSASLYFFPWGGAIAASQLLVSIYFHYQSIHLSQVPLSQCNNTATAVIFHTILCCASPHYEIYKKSIALQVNVGYVGPMLGFLKTIQVVHLENHVQGTMIILLYSV